jgi:uncharacterized protein YdhG (YjbR/CyaY superfamily)
LAKPDREFTKEEKAAMAERAREIRGGNVMGEEAVLAKIGEMPEPDKSLAKRVHELVTKTSPALLPRTWYGMPAYTNKDGKVVCFFQSAQKFKSRYCTLGFQDAARLDEGRMWPTAFAITNLTMAEEEKIARLVKRAVGGRSGPDKA